MIQSYFVHWIYKLDLYTCFITMGVNFDPHFLVYKYKYNCLKTLSIGIEFEDFINLINRDMLPLIIVIYFIWKIFGNILGCNWQNIKLTGTHNCHAS